MSFRSKLLFIGTMLIGCTDDPAVVHVAARATERIELASAQPETAPQDDVTYRWELVMKPDASHVAAPEGTATATFVPDLRGTYVVKRWLAYGLSDRLTHEFVVDVSGIAPEAVLRGDASVVVGTPASFDASQSASVEQFPISYQWRLAERPRDSAAMLTDARAVTTSFIPDVAGVYVIELAVFDGELWSDPHATLQVTAGL